VVRESFTFVALRILITHLYAYHPDWPTNKWELLATNPTAGGHKVHGRHTVFDAGQNALMIVGTKIETDPGLYLYRYANGGSDTTPPTAPTGLKIQ
jgi:hypothetical protein